MNARSIAACVVALLASCFGLHAETVQTIVVTASAMPGTIRDPAKAVTNIQILSGDALNRYGLGNAVQALGAMAPGVSLSEAQGNLFQPNLGFRGFEASPLEGNAQGLAVYVDGVRFNQAFGDTVNWDLLPAAAISSVMTQGSNPIYGLNAIGGAVAIRMKDGFETDSLDGEIAGGSFGAARGSLEYGKSANGRAAYFTAESSHDDGWRAHSPSNATQLYANVAARNDRGEIHLALAGADTDLTGNGAAPVELISARRNAVFTYPDKTENRFASMILFGNYRANAALSLQGNAYVGQLRQRTRNGDASEAEPCDSDPALLCLDNNVGLVDVNGTPVTDFLNGGPYGQLNRTATSTWSFGAAAQADLDGSFLGLSHSLIVGAAIDHGDTRFNASSELGALTAARGFAGPGTAIVSDDGTISPVSVAAENTYYGLYFSELADLTDRASLTLSGRYNIADIMLRDRLGTALNGAHHFAHFNPSAGLSYKLTSWAAAYFGYAQANRAPTPAELSCADPAAPCSLTNFFVGDPALKQVLADTFEAGVGGRLARSGWSLRWHAGAYRTDTRDEIFFTASPVLGRAFFENIGKTRRQGVEASLAVSSKAWTISGGYNFTDATFRNALTLSSPENPSANSQGEIEVVRGDHVPSVPAHQFKVAVEYAYSPHFTVAAGMRAVSGSYLAGDESNEQPRLGGYATFDVGARYRITGRAVVFATVTNLLDQRYATFGTFSPTTSVFMAEAPGASNPRSLSPGEPRAVMAGVKIFLSPNASEDRLDGISEPL